MGRGGHRGAGPQTLAPLLRERLATRFRGGGWSRPVVLRRVLAAVLVLLAAALALRPQPGTATVIVAAHDLAPGHTLTAADVVARPVPAGFVPAGALTEPSGVDGRVLAGAARSGETITDVRLLGADLVRLLAPDGGSATVPIRLSDPDVAGLLAPGSTVDVVSVGERDGKATVLAERATVLAVLDADGVGGFGHATRGQRGRLVVVVLPRQAATQVAAASLSQSLTVTLR
ncbi:MAG TPA: SAF domain-containing protein [Pseudonocardiaceae bacterium]